MKESEEYIKNHPGKTPEEYFEAGFAHGVDSAMKYIREMADEGGGFVTLKSKQKGKEEGFPVILRSPCPEYLIKSDLDKVLEIARKYNEDAEVFPCRSLRAIEVIGIAENRVNTFLSHCFEFVSHGVTVRCVDEFTVCRVCGEPLDFCECGEGA